MHKPFFLLLFIVLTGTAGAQTVEEAKKFLYYDRLNSAEATLKQVVQKEAGNMEAHYWLFETQLQKGDTNAARETLGNVQKLVQGNAKVKMDPLVEAGQVHLLLISGNKAEAMTKSEDLVKDTKGKNPEVLMALAKAQIDARQDEGNYDYALALLDKALKRKEKDPVVYQLMGDAWRRKGDGGKAVSFYTQAINVDPSYARGNYSIGKIYATQKNPDMYVRNFAEATRQDPQFAPAYYELYYHFYFRDVHTAKGFLEKYIANADKTIENDYMMVDLLYVSYSHREAIDLANKLLQLQGDAAKPRLYKLIAYSYAGMGDSTKALQFINTYFEKEKPGNYVAKDYDLKAKLIYKHDGAALPEAIALWEKAVALDTLPAHKIDYMQHIAGGYKQSGDRSKEAVWLGKIYEAKKDPSNLDLYYWGLAHYAAKEYSYADSVFGKYIEKYPDHIHGYLWRAKSSANIDSTMENGLAVPW